MKENVITHLTKKMTRLKINSQSRDKKYLISQKTRDYLQSQENQYIGILPFRSINLPVYNPRKEFFLHQTELLTNYGKMLVLPLEYQFLKIKNNSKLDTLDVLKIKIQKYLQEVLGEAIDILLIQKILEVESSKIIIFTVNITNYPSLQLKKNDKNNDNLIDKMSNLSLVKKQVSNLDLKFKKVLNFYNQIEISKSIKDLYQNIGSLRQNRTTLQMFITLEIDTDSNQMVTSETQHQIHLKFHYIYRNLF